MTAPRAISFENKEKSSRMRAMRRSYRAGKMRTALLEMRTAPQKQCETVLLLQEVFSEKKKMVK